MNRYTGISLIALLILVVALPLYALRERQRLQDAQASLRAAQIAAATTIYLDNCARCHGVDGAGNGVIPALNSAALAGASELALFSTIASPPHGSSMAIWHAGESVELSDYQVEQLVTLIRFGDWQAITVSADQRQLTLPTLLPAAASLEEVAASDPHQCAACHEEPAIHATRFGLDCARCHSTQVWAPAQLTRHTFLLDHGSKENALACQTCHIQTYAAYDCYQCHDHDAAAIVASHVDVDLATTPLETCSACHPTGEPGEVATVAEGFNFEE